jgi:hypothetical protein
LKTGKTPSKYCTFKRPDLKLQFISNDHNEQFKYLINGHRMSIAPELFEFSSVTQQKDYLLAMFDKLWNVIRMELLY